MTVKYILSLEILNCGKLSLKNQWNNMHHKPKQTFHSHLVLNCFQNLCIKYYPHPVYFILPFKTLFLASLPYFPGITLSSLKNSVGHWPGELHIHPWPVLVSGEDVGIRCGCSQSSPLPVTRTWASGLKTPLGYGLSPAVTCSLSLGSG